MYMPKNNSNMLAKQTKIERKLLKSYTLMQERIETL